MDEIKSKILQGAEALFMRYGFKSITMDDIARELGISKKTLYLYFADKSDLVNQTVDNHLETEKQFCTDLTIKEENPIAFLLAISDNFSNETKHINPAVLFDLKKYFKEAYDKIESYSKEFIYGQVLNNIQQGKSAGLYRSELNDNIIALFYVNMVQFMVNPENYTKEIKDVQLVHKELLQYHLHGILTEKGLKQLDKLTTTTT